MEVQYLSQCDWQKDWQMHQWSTRELRIRPIQNIQLVFDKGVMPIQWKEMVFSTNDIRTVGHAHVKKMHECRHRP
jgi:glycyl-tRNA synthetase beta subunit